MKIEQDIRYYLYSFSNFIAAFGGGMILGKGVGLLDHHFLQGGSILAFFVGTTLGLGFLQIIPKQISYNIARFFSILAALTALILLYLFKSYSLDQKLVGIPAVIFFIFLSIRFGFWFYSRVLRASLAAGQKQKIAGVEFGYYAGMIAGLIAWSILGIEIDIVSALIMDACLQFSAGMIDLFVGRLTPQFNQTKTISNHFKNSSEVSQSRSLIHSIIFLTIGIQVVIFSLAHKVSHQFTPLILAFYYLGAAVAAVFCKKYQILLKWNVTNKASFAKIFLGSKINNRGTSFVVPGILSFVCVATAIFGVIYWQWGDSIFRISEIILLFLIFVSAFYYEILALAILDAIGLEESSSNNQNLIMRTYGLLGIGAAISLWLLSISKNSMLSLFLTLFLCSLFSMYFTRRKIA